MMRPASAFCSCEGKTVGWKTADFRNQGACPWVVTQSASPRTNCDLLAPLRVKELQGEQQLDQRVFQASDQEGATPARGKTSTGQAALP
eukprot:scaffold45908_cov17-Tisochrysis_lutea.AAC.1